MVEIWRFCRWMSVKYKVNINYSNNLSFFSSNALFVLCYDLGLLLCLWRTQWPPRPSASSGGSHEAHWTSLCLRQRQQAPLLKLQPSSCSCSPRRPP